MPPRPDIDPLSEAPLLNAIPKEDPFVAPDAFFDRFPQHVQAAVAGQSKAPWWNQLLAASPVPRFAWAAGAMAVVAAVWIGLPKVQLETPATSLAEFAWNDSLPIDDQELLAELAAGSEHAPGVQHDLNADELAAYLMAHDALDFIAELQ